MPSAPDPARARRTRADVVSAAITLADREGLDAVSMRRVAEAVGVVPMALYKHVADKEALVDAMVDQVIAGYQVVAGSQVVGGGDWREAFVARVMAARAALARHPWARRAIETRRRRTPTVLAHMEALTSLLLSAGMSPALAHHGMHALGNRIWGFSPELFNDPAGGGSEVDSTGSSGEGIDPADFPGIRAVAQDAQRRRPGLGCDEDFEFTFALDLILDGLERLHARGLGVSAD